MSRSVLSATTLLLLVTLPLVLAKNFELLNYPNVGCTGTPTVTAVPVDTCLPIPNNKNYSAVKYGIPRDAPTVTIYPWANKNCTSYGEVAYVTCGRCEPAADPSFGPFHRLLCNVKDQKIRSELQCSDNKCTNCAQKYDFAVGQCLNWANGTAYVIATELKKAPALPEILFNATNSTCDAHEAVRVFDAPCGVCLGNAMVNCTLTGSTSTLSDLRKKSARPIRPLAKH